MLQKLKNCKSIRRIDYLTKFDEDKLLWIFDEENTWR